MPLQPIVSIVPCCVEGVIMEVQGERDYCSGLGALRVFYGVTKAVLYGDSKAALLGHRAQCALRLLRARAGPSCCSWTIRPPSLYLSSAFITPPCLLFEQSLPTCHSQMRILLYKVLLPSQTHTPKCKKKTKTFLAVKPQFVMTL